MQYTPPPSPSRSRPVHERSRLFVGLAVIAVFVVVAAASLLKKTVPPPRVDIDTGCPVDQAPAAQTIVLVDNTDSFSPGQVKEFQNHLEDIHQNLSTGQMLTIASISGELPPDILFSRCSPEKGHPFGLLEAFRRREDVPVNIEARYEREFEAPIQKLEKQMPLNKTTTYSPIIGSIGDVIDQIGPQWSGARSRTLIIFSDLLENTKEFSQYHAGNSESFDHARASVAYIREAHLDLQKTDVTIYQLTGRPTSKRLQTNTNKHFWEGLIKDNGGHLKRWISLPANREP